MNNAKIGAFLIVGASLVATAPMYAAVVVVEDGEGSSATLNAKYTKFNNANRVAQITTENPSISAVDGTGAAKYAFDVNGNFFASRYNHVFGSPLDIGAASTGSLDFSFYYTGANFGDRSSGKTLDTIAFFFGDGLAEQGVKLTVVDRETPTVQILQNLQVDAWNTVHLELNDQGKFTSTGSTVNGLPVTTSTPNLANAFSTSGFGSDAQIAAMWGGLTSYDVADEHGGNGGSGAYEGFYGIDNLRFTAVPEPTCLAGVAAGLLGLLSRRRQRA